MRVHMLVLLLAASAGCIQPGCVSCDDDNPCTHDTCVEGGCVHKPLSGPVEGCSGRGGCVEYMCFNGECVIQRVMECCGNGVCEGGEDYRRCPGDCGATCHDGILNQGEEDVDCGGPCTPCVSPEFNYLDKLNEYRRQWSASAGNYTEAIRVYNTEQNVTVLKEAAMKSFGETELIRELLENTTSPEGLYRLQFRMGETLSLYARALREMVLYSETEADRYRLSSNRLLADSLDSDRSFVVEYNKAVDRYNEISVNCVNHLVDAGEESVDCGGVCSSPCELILNVTKHVTVRSEGGRASITLNVSSPAINYPPQQTLLASHPTPEPDARHVSDEGNVYYIYELEMPAYGVMELEVTETVRLYQAPPPAKSDSGYFSSLYLIGSNYSETTDDICFRARMLKGDSSKTRDVVRRIQDWLSENVEYEPNNEELGAQYCYVHRKGACDEHADLFVAMARCAGIPARRVTGSLLNASQVRGHAWAEYYDGGWVYIDPSTKRRNQPYALDNRHIVSCVGDGSYNCGIGYAYTYRKTKPEIEVDERTYLS